MTRLVVVLVAALAIALSAGTGAASARGEDYYCDPWPECQLDYIGGYCAPIGQSSCCFWYGQMWPCFCEAKYDEYWGWYGVWVFRTW